MLNLNIVTSDEAPITRETRSKVAIQLRLLANYLESDEYVADPTVRHPILDSNGRDIGDWDISNPVEE